MSKVNDNTISENEKRKSKPTDCEFNLQKGGVSRVNKTYAPLPLGSESLEKRCSSVPSGEDKDVGKNSNKGGIMKKLLVVIVALILILPMTLNAGWIYKGNKTASDVDSYSDGHTNWYVSVSQEVHYYYHTYGYWGAYISANGNANHQNGFWWLPDWASYGVYSYLPGYVGQWKQYGDEFVTYTGCIKELRAKGQVALMPRWTWWISHAPNSSYASIRVAGTIGHGAGVYCKTYSNYK